MNAFLNDKLQLRMDNLQFPKALRNVDVVEFDLGSRPPLLVAVAASAGAGTLCHILGSRREWRGFDFNKSSNQALATR